MTLHVRGSVAPPCCRSRRATTPERVPARLHSGSPRAGAAPGRRPARHPQAAPIRAARSRRPPAAKPASVLMLPILAHPAYNLLRADGFDGGARWIDGGGRIGGGGDGGGGGVGGGGDGRGRMGAKGSENGAERGAESWRMGCGLLHY